MDQSFQKENLFEDYGQEQENNKDQPWHLDDHYDEYGGLGKHVWCLLALTLVSPANAGQQLSILNLHSQKITQIAIRVMWKATVIPGKALGSRLPVIHYSSCAVLLCQHDLQKTTLEVTFRQQPFCFSQFYKEKRTAHRTVVVQMSIFEVETVEQSLSKTGYIWGNTRALVSMRRNDDWLGFQCIWIQARWIRWNL